MVRVIMPVLMLLGFVFLGTVEAGQGLDGKAIFDAKCAGCHGAEGGGTGMLKPLKGSDFLKTGTDKDIKKIIVEGTSTGMIPMPPMKSKLNKEEIEAVVEYIKNLK